MRDVTHTTRHAGNVYLYSGTKSVEVMYSDRGTINFHIPVRVFRAPLVVVVCATAVCATDTQVGRRARVLYVFSAEMDDEHRTARICTSCAPSTRPSWKDRTASVSPSPICPTTSATTHQVISRTRGLSGELTLKNTTTPPG